MQPDPAIQYSPRRPSIPLSASMNPYPPLESLPWLQANDQSIILARTGKLEVFERFATVAVCNAVTNALKLGISPAARRPGGLASGPPGGAPRQVASAPETCGRRGFGSRRRSGSPADAGKP